jgi:hypothetical protein
MSVARACRRARIKMSNDPRWKHKAKRDPSASARRMARLVEKQKLMSMRKK